MPKTYYDSELTGAQIESALEAIHGVVTPSNNGKVLYIENGQIKAASASRWSGGAVLESLSVTANGDYTPPTGTDGFDSVHVAVPSATLTTKSITQNGTYNASSDNADGYSSVTVNVSGGGSAVVQPLSVTQNGTYNPPSGVDGYAPVTVNVSGSGVQPVADFVNSGYGWGASEVFYTNTANELLATINGRRYEKATNDGAVGLCFVNPSGIMLISTNEDAVKYISYDGSTPRTFTFDYTVSIDNTTWYVCKVHYGWTGTYLPTNGKLKNNSVIIYEHIADTATAEQKSEFIKKMLTIAGVCNIVNNQ